MSQHIENPHIPVSWGELFDKISILEIKASRVVEDGARANIEAELNALRSFLPENGPEQLLKLRSELDAINLRIWEVEDLLREREAARNFDDEFIQLARSVYHNNDERSRVKQKINRLFKSEFVEEKLYTVSYSAAQGELGRLVGELKKQPESQE